MAKVDGELELLKNLIQSTIHDTIKINNTFLTNIQICLQNA